MSFKENYTVVRLIVTPIAPSSHTIEPISEPHAFSVLPLSTKPMWAWAPTVLVIDGEPAALKVEDGAILAAEAGMELIRVPYTDEMSAYEVQLAEVDHTASVVFIPVNPNPRGSDAQEGNL